MRVYRWLSGGVIAVMVAAGVVMLPGLPERLVVRWSVNGAATGFMDAVLAVLFVPLVALVMVAVSIFARDFDPLGDNYGAFAGALDRFVFVFVLFLAYVHGLVLVFNSGGLGFGLVRLVVPAVGVLFVSLGRLLKRVEPNWLFGVQTPWSMRSEVVWRRTNVLAGKLFQAAGIVLVASMVLRSYHLVLAGFSLVLVVFYSVLYSYLVASRRLSG